MMKHPLSTIKFRPKASMEGVKGGQLGLRLVDCHIASRGNPLSCPSHPVLSLRHVDLLNTYHRSDQTYLSWVQAPSTSLNSSPSRRILLSLDPQDHSTLRSDRGDSAKLKRRTGTKAL